MIMPTRTPSLRRMDYYDRNTTPIDMTRREYAKIYDQLSSTNRQGRQNLARGNERYNRVLQVMKTHDRSGQPLAGSGSNSPITLINLK